MCKLIWCVFFCFSFHFFICSYQKLNPAVLCTAIFCIIFVFGYRFPKSLNCNAIRANVFIRQVSPG